MKRILSIAALLLILAAAGAAQQDYSNITNFLRVNDKVCTGGQPTMEDLEKMKAEGIKAIINLRTAEEYDAQQEAAKAKELGLRYVHIAVKTAAPQEEQADAFLLATSDKANFPAFIHCASANRVGAFWMIRRVLKDGWSLEDAEAEARKIGLRSPVLLDFAKKYIEGHRGTEPQRKGTL